MVVDLYAKAARPVTTIRREAGTSPAVFVVTKVNVFNKTLGNLQPWTYVPKPNPDMNTALSPHTIENILSKET